MTPITVLWVLCGVLPASTLSEFDTHSSIPRKSIPFNSGNIKLFREEGVWNYSTILLREDLGLLILGAREAVFALDIKDISSKKTQVHWQVPKDKQTECKYKGKNEDNECRNYIRVLHKVDNHQMYVCGTNAFSPTCDYMTYTEGELKLLDAQEEGKGKCPFDPFQRHSSLMIGMCCLCLCNAIGKYFHGVHWGVLIFISALIVITEE